jgi:hypothetical protein
MTTSLVHRLCAAGIALVALLAPLSACGSGSQCIPQPLKLSNSAPQNGDTITVSAKSGSCTVPGNRRNYTITLSVSSKTDSYEHQLGTATANSTGGFSANVVIPYNVPRANGSIIISGSAFDDCIEKSSDAGSTSSDSSAASAACATYQTAISVGKK